MKVTDVSFEHTQGGLQVEDFSVRKAVWNTDGDVDGTLSALGFKPGNSRVDTVCSDSASKDGSGDGDVGTGEPMQLALQLNKPTDRTARGAILAVTYESAGQTLVHRLGFEVVLCSGPEDLPECALAGASEYDW
ncbi:hypothetical protein GL263_10110 [Streptomyces durbertensis]|uniref:Uncharacterized protein n=1 Tax=Streptomyces durbertensis TaxID=2448886 RepID=A0ABR6EF71_9ACTN|nr:hypothetical protein [Streptomyces durbertensis]MBB1243908.1 hypothetical protein [Streptomyces durbertensis]